MRPPQQQNNMEVVVKNKQSIFDMAVEHFGAFEACLDLAFANDLSMTEDLQTSVGLASVGIYNEKTSVLFGNLYNKPATALSREEVREFCDAVGNNTADFGTFDLTYTDVFYK